MEFVIDRIEDDTVFLECMDTLSTFTINIADICDEVKVKEGDLLYYEKDMYYIKDNRYRRDVIKSKLEILKQKNGIS